MEVGESPNIMLYSESILTSNRPSTIGEVVATSLMSKFDKSILTSLNCIHSTSLAISTLATKYGVSALVLHVNVVTPFVPL